MAEQVLPILEAHTGGAQAPCRNQSRLAIVEHPSTNAECRVKNRKRPQRMRKNTGYHKGHEHQRNEHHPIKHGGRSELSSARTAAE